MPGAPSGPLPDGARPRENWTSPLPGRTNAEPTRWLDQFDDASLRAAVREAVGVARELFEEGRPLIGKLNRRLSLDIDLFLRGGLHVLRKIEAIDYGVLLTRPKIGKAERAALLLRALAASVFRQHAS